MLFNLSECVDLTEFSPTYVCRIYIQTGMLTEGLFLRVDFFLLQETVLGGAVCSATWTGTPLAGGCTAVTDGILACVELASWT